MNLKRSPKVALITAVEIAPRARRRQHEVRMLIEREHIARLQAQEVNRHKDNFLAMISHELRTPVSAILLWIRLAKNGRLEPTKMQQALHNIECGAVAQSQLIDDLLDAARLATAKLVLEVGPCELDATVRRAIEMISPAAEAKSVRINVSLQAR
jgi:signal transduction histidine kinase